MAENSPASRDVVAMLREAELHIRNVLDEMAVVPSAHRARLQLVLRLLDDIRAQLANTGGGGSV